MEKMVLKAGPEALEAVIAFVRKTAEEQGFKGQMFQIELAAEEILINIADYAYPEGEGPVEIRCGMEEGVWKMEFADQGIPFDPLQQPLPDTKAPADSRQVGGLGIYLARQYMDDASYTYADGWNRLTLVKKEEKRL